MIIKKYIPQNLRVIHLHSHKNKVVGMENLTFLQRLNNATYVLAALFSCPPKQQHTISNPRSCIL